jgi:hypothetical protein
VKPSLRLAPMQPGPGTDTELKRLVGCRDAIDPVFGQDVSGRLLRCQGSGKLIACSSAKLIAESSATA